MADIPNQIPVTLAVTSTTAPADKVASLKDLLVSLVIPLVAIIGFVVLAAISKIAGVDAFAGIIAAAGLHVATK